MSVSGLVIKLKSVDYGKTQNWLVFKEFIPQHDNSRHYTFKFCGTELNTTAYLTGDFEGQLRQKLIENLGYPPFTACLTYHSCSQ